MCLPTKNEPSSSGTRSIIGLGALMLVVCLAGPAVAGTLGALGNGVLVGAAGAIIALGMCAAIPAVALAARRRRSAAEILDVDGR